MAFTTADLYDEHGGNLQSWDNQFRQFGGRPVFRGPITTVGVFRTTAGRIHPVRAGDQVRCDNDSVVVLPAEALVGQSNQPDVVEQPPK